MTYHIRRKYTVEENVNLIARYQVDRAISELEDSSLDFHKSVHQVRKRCKKLRGLIRLVRPAFGDYAAQNKAFRDVARHVSGTRDAHVKLACYEQLIDRFAEQVNREALCPVHEHLSALHGETIGQNPPSESRVKLLDDMREAQVHVGDWQIEGHGFETIEGGLKKTYRRARSALSAANADPGAAKVHQWRKRVKYHWYHVRLLNRIWPDVMDARCAALDRLSDLLGEHNDLSVLRQSLEEGQGSELQADPARVVLGLIDQRRVELRSQAWPLGRRLFAEKPKHFATRIGVYWDLWR